MYNFTKHNSEKLTFGNTNLQITPDKNMISLFAGTECENAVIDQTIGNDVTWVSTSLLRQ